MRYFILVAIISSFFTKDILAQNLPPIQLDRPDQTECPFITPKNYIQVENGFTFENINDNIQTISYPSSLWKYGINEKLELRLITEFVTNKIYGKTITGLLPITIGFKTALWEEKGIAPKTSFIGHITSSNIGSEKFHTSYIAPSFRFLMQHTISKKMSLAYNVGAEWNGEIANQTYIYTLTTGYSITEKLACYAELYGFLPKNNTNDHRFDGGFTYLVNNNFMADISAGLRITENSPKNYISLGLSYRFKVAK